MSWRNSGITDRKLTRIICLCMELLFLLQSTEAGRYQPCSPVNNLFRFPGNCFSFLVCDTFGLVPKSCPSNLAFERYQGRCEYRPFVQNCENSVPRDICSPNPCPRGTCSVTTRNTRGYECNCPSGYSGPECAGGVDACAQNNKCQLGICLNTDNGKTVCDCGHTGYTGEYCEIAPTAPCVRDQQCVSGFCQRNWDNYNNNKCLCPPGYWGELCQYYGSGNNPCFPSPCLNGGQCLVTESGTFQCNCPQGVYGPTCGNFYTTPGDPCQLSPCLNGGKCVPVGTASYQCYCTAGFTGSKCEQANTTPVPSLSCQSSPCANGGSCITTAQDYSCLCPPGYMGRRCTDLAPTDLCLAQPCQNGGSCSSDSSGRYTCNCSGTGYTGTTCNTPVNKCETYNPCVRGTCVDMTSGPFCDCTGTGYTGQTCNTTVNGDPCYPDACTHGVCQAGMSNSYTCNCTGTIYTGSRCDTTGCDVNNPCQNGATCLPQLQGGYQCKCGVGFTGVNCDRVVIDCPAIQCPMDVPRYSVASLRSRDCTGYYDCSYGDVTYRTCPPGYKFDVIGMRCKSQTDTMAVFCDYFLS